MKTDTLYVLTLKSYVVQRKGINPVHFTLKKALKERDKLPKEISGKVNISKFYSCGIEEHGVAYDKEDNWT